ncbi:TadE/TadG family type IV pilus assembly protein [Fontibacillus sp. BL9]|uniref:TadE/TadG family type IV pilus assembly protein n=1 Tax=Fontibacillus sp. BL9 TaxID=3389971 RepID=UPI003978C887
MFHRRRSERGAVSVFLIMIFAAVFAFVTIFIDFARIAALQAKTEMLAHAASRSVMSAYDPELVQQYGLFAFGETDANYIMSKVLQDQFELMNRSDDLPVARARLDSSTVELQRPLGTYAVFEQQIREQMKYKAPIDFTIEVVNRFKPMSQVMKEASNTVDLLGKLQKLYDRREAKLDELLQKQNQVAHAAGKIVPLIPRSGGSGFSDGDSFGDGISTAADVASQYTDYAWRVEEDRAREPLERMYTLEISRYQYAASRLFGKLEDANRNAQEQHGSLLPQAKELLNEAREINEQMRLTIKEAEQRSAQNGYNEVSAMKSTGGDGTVTGGDEIAKIRQQSANLLLPESLFADFENDIDAQAALFSALYGSVNSFLSLEGPIISASTSTGELESAVSGMNREADKYMLAYGDSGAGNILGQNKKVLEARRGSDAERKQTEREAQGKLKEANNLIKGISEIKDNLKEQQKQFDQLESFYKANREINQSGLEGEEDKRKDNEDPYDTGSEAMAGMDSLYGGLSGFMKGMSDSCFQTEYIVNYFQFLDLSTLDELLEGSGPEKLDVLADSFAAEKQEVEYILYGFHNPAGNIAAAYGEIFTMRLAIRTMEGLIKNGAKGNPLLVLAAALLYGVEHAVKDMIELTKKGSVVLSDYLKVKLTYRDHLRIFLLLHGRNERRLSRMLAVIRMNTGIQTEERATYLKGTVTAGIPLWFIPGVAKTMGAAGVLEGRVEGSKYYAAKQADFSY